VYRPAPTGAWASFSTRSTTTVAIGHRRGEHAQDETGADHTELRGLFMDLDVDALAPQSGSKCIGGVPPTADQFALCG
jgi:hypothetical protein